MIIPYGRCRRQSMSNEELSLHNEVTIFQQLTVQIYNCYQISTLFLTIYFYDHFV